MDKDMASGQGSNSVQIRQFNQRVVLAHLRRLGRASKSDIARLTNLTANAAGMIVRHLEAEGLVVSHGKKYAGTRGQPATMLSLNPAGAYAVGVRLDRRGIETVLVDFCGEIIVRHAHDIILPEPDSAFAIVSADIQACIGSLPADRRRRVVGIGIAMPYNLGKWLRELELTGPQFRLWDEIDVAAEVARRTGLTTVLENDGTAAAVAELFYGIGRGVDDFLYLFVGPAIGGGVVLGGNYLRGRHGNAGDVATIPVGPSRLSSAPRPARSHDILITRASINSLIRHLADAGHPVDGRADLEAVLDRDPAAVAEWIEDCVDALVAPIYAAAALLDMDVVIVDSDPAGPLLDRIVRHLDRRLADEVPEGRTPPSLRIGSFGVDAAAIGAATLPFHLTYSPSHDILIGRVARPMEERIDVTTF
ncbi:MAG TPA: ROK family protein [Arenibaculum sp.]|nr:ROK family protein [Arenibaculum sp.]